MITARFEFKEGHGADFCPSEGQDVIELKFESVEALIESVEEFRYHIRNCTASVDGKIIDLRAVSGT